MALKLLVNVYLMRFCCRNMSNCETVLVEGTVFAFGCSPCWMLCCVFVKIKNKYILVVNFSFWGCLKIKVNLIKEIKSSLIRKILQNNKIKNHMRNLFPKEVTFNIAVTIGVGTAMRLKCFMHMLCRWWSYLFILLLLFLLLKFSRRICL